MKEIKTREDVNEMVDSFYFKVRKHEELGPIFNEAIGELWFLHIDTLTRFWETLLLDKRSYYGSPFPKHLALKIEPHHFDMWLELFIYNINTQYEGEKAELAKEKAATLKKMFQSKYAMAMGKAVA